MYCTYYISSVLVCKFTINKDYYRQKSKKRSQNIILDMSAPHENYIDMHQLRIYATACI